MLLNLWIITVSLSGIFGDLSFLIGRQNEEQSPLLKSRGNDRLERSPTDHEYHCDHECQINEMLANVGMHLDKEHCHAFEHVHCGYRVVPNEQICSNEGITYPNHCGFIQTSCYYILHHHPDNPSHHVTIQNYGPCHASTTHQVPLTSTTQQAPNMPTTTAVLFTAQPTTKPNPPTTTLSIPCLLGKAFCAHKNEFICAQTFNVSCGSNGKFYPNICEFSKAQCDDNTLTQVDVSKCNLNSAMIG